MVRRFLGSRAMLPVFLFLLLVCAGPLAADEAARLLLVVRGATEDDTLLLHSLLAGLTQRRPDVLVIDGSRVERTGDEAAFAREQGCRAWLRLELDTRTALRLRYAFFDSAAGLLIHSGVFERPTPGLTELAEGFWDELVDELDTGLSLLGQPPLLTISGVPGTRVTGLGSEPLILDAAGQGQVFAFPPWSAHLAAEADGYYRTELAVSALTGGQSLFLNQQPRPAWAFDAGLFKAQFASFEAAWFPGRGRHFLRAGLTSFLLGVSLRSADGQSENPPLLISHGLMHLSLQGGLYFSALESDLRLYGAAGVFSRLAFDGGGPPAPWGLQAAVGFEYSRVRSVRFFFEYTPTFYAPVHVSDFMAAVDRDFHDQYTPLGPLAVDFQAFRIGARFFP